MDTVGAGVMLAAKTSSLFFKDQEDNRIEYDGVEKNFGQDVPKQLRRVIPISL